ncbi:MAG: FtsW/RodA/SpoVE family cell cycle protein [Paludibacteraceae bacterium]|jgi:cell division protein FtsW|nr:FtsW/RodA/SpoVE family cell cycle protein [Paludibacteraceae bacterium]
MKLDTRYIDKTFWAIFLILIFAATVALASASSTLVYSTGNALGPLMKQVLWFLIGIVCAFGMQYVPSKFIRMGGYLVLGISVLCLYVMLIPHNPFVVTINGAGRWFNLFGFKFQPSELAKLSLIIVVADQLSRIRYEEDKRHYFYVTLAITAVTVLPILVGNLSTALLLAGIIFLMWFLARIPWKYLVATASITLGVLVGGYFLVKVLDNHGVRLGLFSRAITWVHRIDDMVAEHQTPDEGDTFVVNDDNYQRSMAKVAIARGGKSPVGVLPGNSQERDYLPLAYADYIFAIIVEETGIVGACLLIFLYLAILFRACWTSSRYEDYAAIFMVMGLALMLTGQALVSMMVAVGIGPVTGQPLPLISRGGTSVIITSLYFGIMMAVSREQAERKGLETESVNESWDDIPDIKIEE